MPSRIQKSAILAHPLGGALLRREHGVVPPRAGETVDNAWARGLARTTYVRARQSICSFALDTATGAILVTYSQIGDGPSPVQYASISHKLSRVTSNKLMGGESVRMPHTPWDDGRTLNSMRGSLVCILSDCCPRFGTAYKSSHRYPRSTCQSRGLQCKPSCMLTREYTATSLLKVSAC